MPVQRAIAAFKTRRLNCAQSVLRAFQQEHGVTEDKIEAAGHHGGGRAEEGRCGALHGALQLADDDSARDNLRKAFVAKASSEKCREIRKNKTLSCEQCVELAAELVAGLKRGE
jgi:hypothetical protein